MPVPTQHPKEGAEAHLHSPRRQSSFVRSSAGLSGHPTGIPGLSASDANANTMLSSMPMAEAVIQKRWSGTASNGFIDPFNLQESDPLGYVDWANAGGPVGFNQGAADSGRTSYRTSTARKSAANCRTTTSDISMPDLGLGITNTPTTISEVMNFSGANLEDSETNNQGLKVPTNTPTTMGLFEDLDTDPTRLSGSESTSWSIINNSDVSPLNTCNYGGSGD